MVSTNVHYSMPLASESLVLLWKMEEPPIENSSLSLKRSSNLQLQDQFTNLKIRSHGSQIFKENFTSTYNILKKIHFKLTLFHINVHYSMPLVSESLVVLLSSSTAESNAPRLSWLTLPPAQPLLLNNQ